MSMPRPEIRISKSLNETTGNRIIECAVYWIGKNIDRPCTFTICLLDKPSYQKIAERFQRAVAAGVVYNNIKIVKDCNQKTYVSAETRDYRFNRGKYLNSDLKSVGF